ncbi:conserved hypothetical protein [Ricinus communis]|uniref:Uncharacterized protein n=1 Tax=Ricinus communis TaxID=3988 RepID=B9SJS4_RICCO|nr:conserved hypothetical protein [Ricinus communis]
MRSSDITTSHGPEPNANPFPNGPTFINKSNLSSNDHLQDQNNSMVMFNATKPLDQSKKRPRPNSAPKRAKKTEEMVFP